MIPEELKSGDRLEAGWLNRLVRAVVARTVNAGPGLLKTQTPAGTTLSLAPQRRASAAPAESDFPWRVTATPDGEGGARLKMSPGAIIADTANGPVLYDDIHLHSGSHQISTAGYVVLRISTSSFDSLRVTFETAVPANTSTYNYIPVAKITKTGDLYAVSQYLAGAFLAIAAVNEEI